MPLNSKASEAGRHERNESGHASHSESRSWHVWEGVPLHLSVLEGKEKQYLIDCIDSDFVSFVGVKVTEFEQQIPAFTGAGCGIATVNHTVALQRAGVERGDEVTSQALHRDLQGGLLRRRAPGLRRCRPGHAGHEPRLALPGGGRAHVRSLAARWES
ncbi:DegT/DnrJ/EryC1/StrS family aminotransferase [Luteimonas changyuni]